jgi:hypothetical protein
MDNRYYGNLFRYCPGAVRLNTERQRNQPDLRPLQQDAVKSDAPRGSRLADLGQRLSFGKGWCPIVLLLQSGGAGDRFAQPAQQNGIGSTRSPRP